MQKPTMDITCPSCKTACTVPLGKAEFSTFQVKCPQCGTMIQLHSIKGFKQVKLRRPSKEEISKEFRDAREPSNN